MADINFDFTTGSLPGGITFTRSSIGTYINNVGTLITASADVARFNYVAGVANLLIEPAATNLLLQSNAFNISWSKLNGGVTTAAQFVSPDGTNNGWSLTAPGGYGAAYQSRATWTAVPHTISVWAKGITGTGPLRLTMVTPFLDIVLTSTLTRVSAVLTPPAVNDNAYIYEFADPPGTAGIYGAQVEVGSKMTSYIPTTTAIVTRAADSAVFTIPAGVSQLTYTFDDNSTQVVAVSSGSYTIPTTLNRPNIKSIFGPDTASVSSPTSDKPAGTYVTSVTVALTCATAGATMCYRTDGVDPVATTPGTCSGGSTTYTVPIVISSTTTLKVIGSKAGSTNSPVVSILYTIRTPVVYYVSTSGSDAANGTTIATPWAHAPGMTGATGVAASTTLLPGDSVLLKRGDSWLNTTMAVPAGGSAGTPITLGAYSTGARPIISGPADIGTIRATAADRGYWTLDNLDLRASGLVPGIVIPAAVYHDYWGANMLPVPGWIIQNCISNAAFYLSGPNTTVRSCTLDGTTNAYPPWGGIVFRSPVNTDGLVEYCEVSNFTDRGIWFFDSADRGTVRYNNVHHILTGPDNFGTCINMDGFGSPVVDGLVYGNYCHNSDGMGVSLENSFRTKVYFNYIHDVTWGGISLINYDTFQAMPLNAEVTYNIIYRTNLGIVLNFVNTVKFIGNTIYEGTGATSQGFSILSVDTIVSALTFTNNIIAGNWAQPIRAQTTKNVWTQFDYNDITIAADGKWYYMYGTSTNWTIAQVRTNLTAMVNGITTVPTFATASGSPFGLTPTSAARSTGVNMGATYQTGMLPTSTWPTGANGIITGTQAASWNMGAYLSQVGGTSGVPGTINNPL